MAYGLQIRGPGGTVVFNETDDFNRTVCGPETFYLRQAAMGGPVVTGKIYGTNVNDPSKTTIMVVLEFAIAMGSTRIITERYGSGSNAYYRLRLTSGTEASGRTFATRSE